MTLLLCASLATLASARPSRSVFNYGKGELKPHQEAGTEESREKTPGVPATTDSSQDSVERGRRPHTQVAHPATSDARMAQPDSASCAPNGLMLRLVRLLAGTSGGKSGQCNSCPIPPSHSSVFPAFLTAHVFSPQFSSCQALQGIGNQFRGIDKSNKKIVRHF